MQMHVHDAVVIGAGQAGLSTSYHLRRLGLTHVVLDADDRPGGAWQHRWDSLTMADVHGVADLPDAPAPGSGEGAGAVASRRANVVIPAWFGDYERTHDLPVLRPVAVEEVRSEGPAPDGLLGVRAGDRVWRTRTVVNATGTWRRPFLPAYPGAARFAGEQFHTATYPGVDALRGRRVLVVGGGASATQFLGELAPVTDVLWATRRPPRWSEGGEFDGREIIRRVQERVARGLPPESVSSVTGIRLRPQEQAAAALGVYERRLPMFARIEEDGVRWADGRFEPVDVILWATGFRAALDHLAPLRLRTPAGGIALLPAGEDVQTATTAVADPRVQLVGYGPSASTIGGNRAGRAAALAVRRFLDERALRVGA